MASATGLPCKVDPALVSALRSQKSGNYLVFDLFNYFYIK